MYNIIDKMSIVKVTNEQMDKGKLVHLQSGVAGLLNAKNINKCTILIVQNKLHFAKILSNNFTFYHDWKKKNDENKQICRLLVDICTLFCFHMTKIIIKLC
jgi:hypothetical protein